jgi:hypothetical protein
MNCIKKIQILGIGTFILCLIGLYNGYPLVYSDTGTYLYSGFDTFIPLDRPITYGLFIKFFSFKYSAWFVIIVQNFLTAFVIYEFLKIFLFKKERFVQLYYSILFFLVIFTGIGWYSNQLMPDFFTPLIIVIIFTLLLAKDLSIYSQILLIVILVFGLSAHFSHLLIASILIVTIIFLRKIFKEKLNELSLRRIILVALLIFLGWFVLPVVNYLTEKQFILSKGSHAFIMAHLNDTGILKKFLNENCESADFKDCKLCQYKDSLPVDLDGFLWSGKILENTGGWLDSKEEYNKIIAATLKKPKYLFLNIYKSFTYGLIQLTKNEIGQGLSAYNEGSPPYGQIHWRFNDELNNYLNSRQNRWNGVQLKLDILNAFHSILIIVSLLICILLFTSSIFKSIELNGKYFLIFSILSILINSFVTAGLNSPCERFQARVIWLLPLSIIIILIENYALIIKTIYTKRS